MDEFERLRGLDLTVVLRTSEPALRALLETALDQQNIDYAIRLAGTDALTAGGPAYRGTPFDGPVEVLVRSEDAEAAAELVRDLEAQAKEAGPVPPAPAPAPRDAAILSGNIELVDLASKSVVGRITEDDLAWLKSQLEKESEDDRDYYFDRPTLDMLGEKGASQQLMAVLRGALGSRDEMDLQWFRR